MPSINIIFSYESPRKIVKHPYFAVDMNKLQPKFLKILKANIRVNILLTMNILKLLKVIWLIFNGLNKLNLLSSNKCKTNLT